MKTDKQIQAWLKVKLSNHLAMVDRLTPEQNRERLANIYNKLLEYGGEINGC